MKQLLFSILIIFLFTHCSSSRMIRGQNDFVNNLNKINYLGSSNESKVFLLDNTSFNCYYLDISKDSLTFSNVANDSTYHISINQLSKIIIKDNTASLLGGLWVGLGSGALAVLVSALASDCKTCHPNIGPLIIGAIAIPIGFIAGYNLTGEKEFIFNIFN